MQVQEAYLESSEEDRDVRLYYMLAQHPGRTLVFANAISTVRRLAAILRLLQLPAVALHASMQQRQRLKALDRFRQSEAAVLIATDVAARGLDIQVQAQLLCEESLSSPLKQAQDCSELLASNMQFSLFLRPERDINICIVIASIPAVKAQSNNA